MTWFYVSYHSIGVFVTVLLLWLMSLFLISKKDKTPPTWWLFGVLFGYSILLFGYVFGYSVNAPWGAFHRYFTLSVVFGNWCFIGFAYNFPKLDFPKETKIVLPVAFIILTFVYFEFILSTLGMEKIYNFTAHTYTFDYGAGSSIFIFLSQVLPLSILIRKTILYSNYQGFFSSWLEKRESTPIFPRYYLAKFFIGWIKFLKPKGKEAIASKGFAVSILLLLTIAISNILNKSGSLSYETYAMIFSNLTLIICFYLVITYINNSPEPTTFMVKLVGVSLVTILMVIGFVGNLTLSLSEKKFDNERKIEIQGAKKDILTGNYKDLPPNIQYIIKKPKESDIFNNQLELLFVKDDAGISSESIQNSFQQFKDLTIRENLIKVMKEKSRNIKKDIPTSLEIDEAILRYKNSRQYDNTMKEYKQELTRLYRMADERFIHFDFTYKNNKYEVGYFYNEYRKVIHETAISLVYIIIGTMLIILTLFPKFFHSSLVKPLNNLLDGVKKVNDGNFEIKVPIKVQDEIGYLAGSFNSMVASIKEARQELQDYAENLEEKVIERTKEVKEKMDEVHKLKVQQDGDYFLTSLLAKPLFFNANKSKYISTEFLIRQKKKFEFRNKTADLGGDICISGNLRFGTPDNNRRFTMAMNGDAMGKSMQGAGGSLVMGVVMNAIMSRSASNKKVLDITPEKWLSDVYYEIDSVFKSFNGTMVISGTIMLLDELSGEIFYINAEHPASILYRDGKASFIEKELLLRKFGSESEFDFAVQKFQLLPGDIVILGSDGRDDIDLTPEADVRTINEDETMILSIVEKADANIERITKMIEETGDITDDLSFLKIVFQPTLDNDESSSLDTASSDESTMGLQQIKQLYQEGNIPRALEILSTLYSNDPSNPKLNKMLGLLSFKGKNYEKAVEVLDNYLKQDPDTEEVLYYLALSHKRMGNYISALETSKKVYEIDPNHVSNLVNLSDLYRLTGDHEKARTYAEQVLEIDNENKNAKKILGVLR